MKRFLYTLMVSAIPGAAFADIPPPRGYVEDCTIANVQKDGEECIERSAWHGDVYAAQRYLGDFGYCRRCKTYGATTFGEIYCRQKTSDKPLPSTWEADIKALTPRSGDPEPSAKPLVPECPAPLSHDSRSRTRGACHCAVVGSDELEASAALSFLAAFLVLGLRRPGHRSKEVAPEAHPDYKDT